MLEERIWEVGRHVRRDGKLGSLLLWLHEAEALLNYYETDERWICEVPPKFLLRQHEVCLFIELSRFPFFLSFSGGLVKLVGVICRGQNMASINFTAYSLIADVLSLWTNCLLGSS